jgi:hypothetical protein
MRAPAVPALPWKAVLPFQLLLPAQIHLAPKLDTTLTLSNIAATLRIGGEHQQVADERKKKPGRISRA